MGGEFDYDAFTREMEQLAESVIGDDTDDDYGDDDFDEEEDDGADKFLLGYDSMNPYKDEEEKSSSSTIQVGSGDGDLVKELPEFITDADIEKYASVLYPKEKTLHSLVLEIFTPEQLLELESIRRNLVVSNNKKAAEIKRRLTEWNIPYSTLGPGTNRLGLLLEGWTIKIALDSDGEIDNKREFIYSMQLYPYVIKCYECVPNGLIAVFEYVEVFSLDDFYKAQDRMREILKEIASGFLIGDVGISTINYMNWGHRGEEVCILDFAYIYSVKFKTFACQCSADALLHYDKDFNNLICPACGRKYSFKDIRKKISRKDQDAEIGDITKKGYTISHAYEVTEFNPNFTDGARDRIFKALMKLKKKKDRKISMKEEHLAYDPDDGLCVGDILSKIRDGEFDGCS